MNQFNFTMTETNLFNYKFKHLIANHTRTDGWVNATKWCNHFGKQWQHFKQLPQTQRFIKVLENKTDNPCYYSKRKVGTWIHPLLAIKLAEWLSPEAVNAGNKALAPYKK